MNIDRRHLVLPALAIGLLGVVPALATSSDEDAVAKGVEAFRLAQIAADAKAFGALCAAELSYSHSDGRVEDKATFIANATNGKSKFLALEYLEPQIRGLQLLDQQQVPVLVRTARPVTLPAGRLRLLTSPN